MRIPGIVAAAAVLLAAGPAAAKGPSAWVKCDGLAKPEGAGTTVARILAVTSTMGLLGLPENSRFEPAATGAAGVAACTEVLADPVLDKFWARRVSLLRARALHHIEANDLDAALADLKATHGAAAGDANEVFYNRSLGLSVELFEAALLAKQGQQNEAEALAIRAADARPYSADIVALAAGVLMIDPAWTPEKDRILTRLAALDPVHLRARAMAREWGGDPKAAADDWAAALAASDAIKRPAGFPKRDRVMLARTAFALARAGRAQEARALLPDLNAPITPPPNAAPGTFVDLQFEQVKTYAPVIEAQALYAEGKVEEAGKVLAGLNVFPTDPGVIELIGKVKPVTPYFEQFDPPSVMAGELARQRAQRAGRLELLEYAKALPPLEQAGRGNKYGKQVWGWSTEGFKDKALKDEPNGRSIEFNGSFSEHAAVEEMMLMRAAQLALEAGKPAFIVREREDYRQILINTAYGSQTPAGFRTRADIVFVDPAAPPPAYAGQQDRMLSAEQVWAALSPIHGGERKKK